VKVKPDGSGCVAQQGLEWQTGGADQLAEEELQHPKRRVVKEDFWIVPAGASDGDRLIPFSYRTRIT